jgi:perosamine synthetase
MIPWGKPHFFGNEEKFLLDSFNSTWISNGPYVDRFEEEFSKLNGTKYCVTTNNGTTALSLALLGLEIKAGDEVIIPGFCFISAGNTVIQAGAKPAFVDIDKDTWNIDPKLIKDAINSRTRAIIVVHNYGNMCEMDEIMNIAKEKNIWVIEDCAEAMFSKYKGKYAGTFGDLGCFSFQATKTITMGEGGAVITDDPEIQEKMRKIRSHGMTQKKYFHDMIGCNYRLTNLQASLGCAQLQNLDEIISRKNNIYKRYLKNFSGDSSIVFQKIDSDVEPLMWVTAIKIDPDFFKGNRDFIMQELLKKGIETRPGFYPFSVMPIYDSPPLPIAESVSSNIISLPSFTGISDEEIDYICSEIKNLKK